MKITSLLVLLMYFFCGSFELYAQNISYAEKIRQKTLQILDINKVYKLNELSETPIEVYEMPNDFHKKGEMHAKMYRSKFNNKKTLVKMFEAEGQGAMDPRDFEEELFGLSLASEIGGPEIYRAGKLKLSNGKLMYFIEMEELFNELMSFTMKGIAIKSVEGELPTWAEL